MSSHPVALKGRDEKGVCLCALPPQMGGGYRPASQICQGVKNRESLRDSPALGAKGAVRGVVHVLPWGGDRLPQSALQGVEGCSNPYCHLPGPGVAGRRAGKVTAFVTPSPHLRCSPTETANCKGASFLGGEQLLMGILQARHVLFPVAICIVYLLKQGSRLKNQPPRLLPEKGKVTPTAETGLWAWKGGVSEAPPGRPASPVQ